MSNVAMTIEVRNEDVPVEKGEIYTVFMHLEDDPDDYDLRRLHDALLRASASAFGADHALRQDALGLRIVFTGE